MPCWFKKILAQLHDGVLMGYNGCGLIAPEALKRARVLGLGCGACQDFHSLS
ncbi:MAG: hypothetical protein P8P24_06155 [Planktomarina sp.]|uniref:hypothetical protein n=1 Tax=Planktomarina sp. TaxID=2024851 RepID=UPI00288F11B9|nr:hypothetical protein [Planktomarina sp.]MDG1294852.1 hypothetical protein [Planktomarina sp.]MDT2030807.1 hypothetical protein [Planktomarina sp.]